MFRVVRSKEEAAADGSLAPRHPVFPGSTALALGFVSSWSREGCQRACRLPAYRGDNRTFPCLWSGKLRGPGSPRPPPRRLVLCLVLRDWSRTTPSCRGGRRNSGLRGGRQGSRDGGVSHAPHAQLTSEEAPRAGPSRLLWLESDWMFHFLLRGGRWGIAVLFLDIISLIIDLFAVTVTLDSKVGTLMCW